MLKVKLDDTEGSCALCEGKTQYRCGMSQGLSWNRKVSPSLVRGRPLGWGGGCCVLDSKGAAGGQCRSGDHVVCHMSSASIIAHGGGTVVTRTLPGECQCAESFPETPGPTPYFICKETGTDGVQSSQHPSLNQGVGTSTAQYLSLILFPLLWLVRVPLLPLQLLLLLLPPSYYFSSECPSAPADS